MKCGIFLIAAAVSLAAQAPYQDRFITVNGLRLHYLDWGSPDKQPFIMLHEPKRTNEIVAGFARRVQQEENGWASEDELVASLTRGGGRQGLLAR